MAAWKYSRAILPTFVALVAPSLFRTPVASEPSTSSLTELADRPGAHPSHTDRERLRVEEPSFVFVGNSMLESRIDPVRLNELIQPERAFIFTERSTGLLHWYLWLENELIPSGVRPRRVFVFFQGRSLSAIRMSRPDVIDRLAEPKEPALARLESSECSTWRDAVAQTLISMYPITAHPSEDWLRYLTDWLTPAFIFGEDNEVGFHDKLNDIFDLGRLRGSAFAIQEPSATEAVSASEFEAQLDCTLLPLVIDLMNEHQIPMSFVRIQDRPLPTGQLRPADPSSKAYFAALRRYLDSRKVELIDFSGDPEIPLSVYGAGHHIAPSHTREWTDLFHRRMERLF